MAMKNANIPVDCVYVFRTSILIYKYKVSKLFEYIELTKKEEITENTNSIFPSVRLSVSFTDPTAAISSSISLSLALSFFLLST